MGVLLVVHGLPWSLEEVVQVRAVSRADRAMTVTGPWRRGLLPSLGNSCWGFCSGKAALPVLSCCSQAIPVMWASSCVWGSLFLPLSPVNSVFSAKFPQSEGSSVLHESLPALAFPANSKDKESQPQAVTSTLEQEGLSGADLGLASPAQPCKGCSMGCLSSPRALRLKGPRPVDQ